MLHLANSPDAAAAIRARFEEELVLPRVWSHDHTVWKDDPAEIENRLGWLHLPERVPKELDRIDRFVADVREGGFRHVLLLGMGGSSLAPETFSLTFGNADGYPDLTILDSTYPDAVLGVEETLDLSRTLFLVATKSGTTTETLSFFRYFLARVLTRIGPDDVGRRFGAITDPGSPLVELAERGGFREIFENDPNLGGRYAALSLFGLIPAALLGVEVRQILRRAQSLSRECARSEPLDANPAVRLAAFLGAAARDGRDKATFIISEEVAAFGNWVEQLIAESTGKEGTGILPVVGEPIAPPATYGSDRLFVHLRLADDCSQDAAVAALAEAGHPTARIDLDDRYAIGEQFFLWELATALVGEVLQINPFDQPNVEAAKILARRMVDAYRKTGSLPADEAEPASADAIERFLASAGDGAYIALHAYLPPSRPMSEALTALRVALRDRYRVATTVGYGPRFLHSTGQLHKGDGGRGLFIQLLTTPEGDVPIPDQAGETDAALTFGTLIEAQSHGDRRALLDAGRRVLALRLGDPTQIEDLARKLT